MFGTEKGDELGYFVVIERVAEAGHLLAAVFDLGGNLHGLHGLADVGERRSLLGSLAGGSVAVGAALITKKVGSGLLVGFGSKRMDGKSDQASRDQNWKQIRKRCFECSHMDYFRINSSGTSPDLDERAQFYRASSRHPSRRSPRPTMADQS